MSKMKVKREGEGRTAEYAEYAERRPQGGAACKSEMRN
jgi:hypothetical protein